MRYGTQVHDRSNKDSLQLFQGFMEAIRVH
jgi:hypothetical protein